MAESGAAASQSNGSEARRLIPCVCHGHTRPVTHLCFSTMNKKGEYQIVSSSKDSVPMMRKGDTGDWLGSWIGHQGAVWCTRQSNDWSRAVSASADYRAHVWDAHTGQLLYILHHEGVVRAVDFCPGSNDLVVSAGKDGVLWLWSLSDIGIPASDGADDTKKPIEGTCYIRDEHNQIVGNQDYVQVIGKHRPKKEIKFAVWLGFSKNEPGSNVVGRSGTIVTTQEKSMYWWQFSHAGTRNFDGGRLLKEHAFDSEITCCERYALDQAYSEESDIGGGMQVLGVAAGKKAVFFGGQDSSLVLKEFNLDWRVSSVAVDIKNRKVLLGQADSTWAVLLDWDTGVEEQTIKSHHGPIHSMAYSPDNKVFATGSEDGTVRLWKNCEGDYGLWVASKSAAEAN